MPAPSPPKPARPAAPAADPHADDPAPCPCGAPARYTLCCGRWHAGPQHLQAPDALALMRSRYSAYVRGLEDYLLATWHASTRPTPPVAAPANTQWLGLEVRHHEVLDADHARVEFVARSKRAGRATRLHENSSFVREDGRWWYVDGTTAPEAPARGTR